MREAYCSWDLQLPLNFEGSRLVHLDVWQMKALNKSCIFNYVSLCGCVSVHVSARALGGQKRMSDPLGLELQVIVTHPL